MTVYRRAWTMQLLPGAEERYDKAHAAIWPELAQQMVEDGISCFHLFRDGQTVFAYQERAQPFPTARSTASALTEKWWAEMASLMVTDADGRPRHRVLSEVFSLTGSLQKAAGA
jgi:L-rhamnose mutarotase